VRIGRRTALALAAGEVALIAGAVAGPWSQNAIAGSRPAGEVLADAGTAATVTFAVAGAMAIVLQPAIGRPGRRRWLVRWAGFVCALYATLAALAFAVAVSGTTARAYTVDSAGDLSEPIAHSHLGPGLWCATALGLLVLAVHITVLVRRA
jgi:hypothetical protein